MPSDWNYRQSSYLEFWAQFKEPLRINTRETAKVLAGRSVIQTLEQRMAIIG